MAKPKMARWVCPKCQTGKLAPMRPRRDDVRRYCLPCSEETGRLVERISPALERKRATSTERSKAKAKAKQERERKLALRGRAVTVLDPDGTYGILDGEKTAAKMLRLSALRSQAEWWTGPPDIEIRQSRKKQRTSGHCYPGERVVLTVGVKQTRAEVEAILLHELAHYVCDPHVHHSREWREVYVAACRQWWGREFDVVVGEDSTWRLDERVIEEANRLSMLQATERTEAT